jgi:transposase
MDQLNTHKSESLVRFVIDKCNLDIDEKTLGKKGSSGILKSMETRSHFLSNPEHNIYIVYTPKHASWLNQIEIWFSIIKRHLLNRRASFKSVKELEDKIKEYIIYYNENLAKPFIWNYTGKILKA